MMLRSWLLSVTLALSLAVPATAQVPYIQVYPTGTYDQAHIGCYPTGTVICMTEQKVAENIDGVI